MFLGFQVLLDFIGSHNDSTEFVIIREMTSALSIMSTAPGTLLDHKITSPLNIHVQWLHMEDKQVKTGSFIYLTFSFWLF